MTSSLKLTMSDLATKINPKNLRVCQRCEFYRENVKDSTSLYIISWTDQAGLYQAWEKGEKFIPKKDAGMVLARCMFNCEFDLEHMMESQHAK